VADELDIELLPGYLLPDERIAKAAVDALSFNVAVPRDSVAITVDNGWITLTGEVPWYYQKRAAENAVRLLYGVKGVINQVVIKAKADLGDIKHRIEDAYKRSARIDASHVKVAVQDGAVTLTGTVATWTERKQAENAAWSAPGVYKVKNDLRIEAPVGAW
jgi:osmotically-inducible protein OsmY